MEKWLGTTANKKVTDLLRIFDVFLVPSSLCCSLNFFHFVLPSRNHIMNERPQFVDELIG